MLTELYSTKEFIIANNLREVTEPILFEKGNIPTANGLLSTDIFGTSVKERKQNFAFIRLNGHFFNPFIYKMLKRMDRRFESITHGSKNYIIKDGELVEDEEKGQTGLEFIYENWEKLKFEKNNSVSRNERVDVLNYYKKDVIFTEYWIVIPAFYRDVNLQSASSGRVSRNEITDYYSKLIRLASMINSSNNFDFVLNSTRAKLQDTLVELYDLLKGKLEKKHGFIRKSLLGKSVDYGARSVISAPIFNAEKPEDLKINFHHTGVPLAQCCSLFTPFIVSWVKNFFRRELEMVKNKYPVMRKGQMEYIRLEDPEMYFNDEYIKKQIDRFVHSPADRFTKIELPVHKDDVVNGKPVYMAFKGRSIDGNPDNPINKSPLINRPATWTDILFQAAVDVTADKHVYITRYPLLDYFGSFPNKITVLSTHDTMPIYIGSKLYKHYPKINTNENIDNVSISFIDTVSFSNLYLQGLGGDYDGDQITIKGVYSQEANQEAERLLYAKTHILNVYGANMRSTTNEGVQTLYMLTRFVDS